jgi:uncharacterized protein (TIGR00369 family)
MSDLEQRISASFRAQGLMTILGAELVHVAEGEVHIALSPRPELWSRHGHVHAGVLTSVLDSACGYAAMTVAQPDFDARTAEFAIKFLRPAARADRFVAVGKVMTVTATMTTCQGEIFGEQGSQREAIAVMKTTIMNVPPDA